MYNLVLSRRARQQHGGLPDPPWRRSRPPQCASGYGENKLTNHCANGVRCTEEEHQQNRRTEFKVVKVRELASTTR